MVLGSDTATWREKLPPVAGAMLDRFASGGHRFVLIGPAARSVATGTPVDELCRLEFVVDADLTRIRHVLKERPAVSHGDDNGRRAVVVSEGSGDEEIRVTVRPMRTANRPARDPLLSDLISREITLHAIAIDEQGAVVDPFGGLDDLAARRLRTVVSPAALADEPARWLLRMARHAGYYGFAVDPAVVTRARELAPAVLDLNPDVWREELERALLHRYPDIALQYLCDAGLLQILLPEVTALVGFEKTCPVHHKDLWHHTKLVVQRSRPDRVHRWTALLHDVGKVATRSFDESGVHFFRHEELSAVLFVGAAARLRFPADLAAKVEYLIANHSRVSLYSTEWSDSAIRRLIRETGEHLDDLMTFSRADITSRREERIEELRGLMAELEERIAEVREKDARQPALPKGIGRLIMERFQIAEGPVVGVLRKRLENAVEAGTVARGLSSEEYLDQLAEWLDEERGQTGS